MVFSAILSTSVLGTNLKTNTTIGQYGDSLLANSPK